MGDIHRPWEIPSRPWIMKQTWYDLLFAHWKVDIKKLRPLIPSPLQIDTYDGEAWISVVPFSMRGIRLRYLPPIPFTSNFPEINVRTYVMYDGKPGVYFFRLDASNPLAVITARFFYHLPYSLAKISIERKEDYVLYKSKSGSYCFKAKYKPTSEVFTSKQGSLDYWLTERYCLYTTHNKKLYRGEILHEPWQLQQAEADISINTMFPTNNTSIKNKTPLLHYSNNINVVLWGLNRIE